MSVSLPARLAHDKRGAAAVEFVLIAPLFLLLAIGAMEVSVAIHKGSSVQWAIERAARTAMLDKDTNQDSFQDLVDANLAEMGVEASVNIAYSRTTPTSGPVLGRASATYVHTVRPIFLPSFPVSFEADVSFPQAS